MTLFFQMLLNLHKKSWVDGLTLQDYSDHCKLNEEIVKEMLDLAKNYHKVGGAFICGKFYKIYQIQNYALSQIQNLPIFIQR